MSKKQGLEAIADEKMLTTYRMEDGSFDFQAMLTKASQLLGEQAMMGAAANGRQDLKTLELNKAKATNFLDAINGIIEVKHQVELLAAQEKSFKRSDELDVLNMLMNTCRIQAKGIAKTLVLARKRINVLIKAASKEDISREESVQITEEIAILQNVLTASVDTTQKQIAAFSRLVQLERLSGNRPWAVSRAKPISYSTVEGLAGHDGDESNGARQGPPRKMTEEEIEAHKRGG